MTAFTPNCSKEFFFKINTFITTFSLNFLNFMFVDLFLENSFSSMKLIGLPFKATKFHVASHVWDPFLAHEISPRALQVLHLCFKKPSVCK